MVPANEPPIDLEQLARLFYPSLAALGRFDEVSAEQMPPHYARLLNHEHHMTVTVEEFHGCPVDVQVLDRHRTADHYARKILLVRQSDRTVVQYGIMRVHWRYLDPAVRVAVEEESTPLGRILIEHDVMRSIHLRSLWRVSPGVELCHFFGLPPDSVTYGRTALIRCDEEPAIELLEIVAPK
jgi:chorismate-pyruvate lyase